MAKNNGNTPVETRQKGPPITQGSRPPAQIRETEVTLWLKENSAGEFAAEFFEKGFYYVKDITEKDLNELIKDKPGIRNMLARLIQQEKEKPVPEIPKLPEGTKWDLSSPTLETPDGVKFAIPNALQVPKDDRVVVSPGSMTPEQWMVVARNSCMLYGRRMDGAEPVVASYPVLHWKVPKSNNFMRSEHLAAEVKSELTYTESSSNYVRQGFSKAQATLSVPYCAASIEREDNEKRAACAKTKQLFMTGIWNYPRARVLLEECTVVSPRFVKDITVALLEADANLTDEQIENLCEKIGLNTEQPSEVQRQAAQAAFQDLRGKIGLNIDKPTNVQVKAAKKAVVNVGRVLLRYGHIVGLNVEVGGRLFFVYHKEVSETVNSHEEQATIGAAVGIKTGGPVGAEVGVKDGTGTADREEAHYIAETVSFTALGGDTTLASNPQAWAPTVKDPNLWAVIGIAEAKKTIDLLPELQHAFVQEVWKKYGGGYLDGCSVRLEGRNIYGRCHITFVPVNNVDELQFVAYYMRYGPVDKTVWIINCFRDDIYWIQHKDSGRVLICEDMEFPLTHADPKIMEDPSERWKALWHIHPVDPEGTYGDQYRDCYWIESIANGSLLSGTGLGFLKKDHMELSVNSLPEVTLGNADSGENTALVWKLDPVEDM